MLKAPLDPLCGQGQNKTARVLDTATSRLADVKLFTSLCFISEVGIIIVVPHRIVVTSGSLPLKPFK